MNAINSINTHFNNILDGMEATQRALYMLKEVNQQPESLTDRCSLLVYCNQNSIKLPVKRKIIFEAEETFTYEPAQQKDKRGKPGIEIMFEHTGKDPIRPQFHGVYFDKGNMIATDAHTLVIVKAGDVKQYARELIVKYLKKMGILRTDVSSIVDETWTDPQGKIMNRDGDIIEARFPDYKAVIPQDGHEVTYPAQLLCDLFLTHKTALQNAEKGINAVAPHLVIKFKEMTASFNPALLHRVVKTLWDNGAKDITISYSTPSRAIVFTADNKDKGLCMPLIMTEETHFTGLHTTTEL